MNTLEFLNRFVKEVKNTPLSYRATSDTSIEKSGVAVCWDDNLVWIEDIYEDQRDGRSVTIVGKVGQPRAMQLIADLNNLMSLISHSRESAVFTRLSKKLGWT